MKTTATKPNTCSECGAPRIGTWSGSVCPNGHGKLYPKMNANERRCNEAILAGIPYASDKGAKFQIPGVEGVFEGKRVTHEKIHKICKDEDVAIYDGRVCKFSR